MLKRLIVCLLGLLLVNSPAARAEIMDRIVATVNGEIITLQELEERMAPLLKHAPTNSPAEKAALRRQVLEALIDLKLTVQEGRRLGLEARDAEVEQALERLLKRNGVTREEFEADLKASGTSLAAFREDLRADLTKMKLVNMEIRSRIVITDEQVEEYLKAHPEELERKPKVHLRNILLALPPEADPGLVQAKQAQAQRILAEIKSGLDFAQAARRYSEAPNAEDGGELGLISLEDMIPEIRQAVKDLDPGQVSKVVQIERGLQVFQVVERVTGDQAAEAKVRSRVRDLLAEREMARRYEKWVEELRARSIIKINH